MSSDEARPKFLQLDDNLTLDFAIFGGLCAQNPSYSLEKCYNLGSTLALFLDFLSYPSIISNFQKRIEALAAYGGASGRGRLGFLSEPCFDQGGRGDRHSSVLATGILVVNLG
jgi:hypothetical protein